MTSTTRQPLIQCLGGSDGDHYIEHDTLFSRRLRSHRDDPRKRAGAMTFHRNFQRPDEIIVTTEKHHNHMF